MAATIQCLSSSYLALRSKLSSLSIKGSSPSTNLSFSAALSHDLFSKGCLPMSAVQRPMRRSAVVVCEAAPKKKADSAAKRAGRKKAVGIHHGWYTSTPAVTS